MNINPLSANLINILSPNNALTDNANGLQGMGQADIKFANILSDALSAATQADAVDKVSALELLTGQSDDLSGLLIDAQKAELSLNLALQLRNKVIDAYNEVMRMQV